MPAAYKDQHVRFGWVQFAPGGIASGQGVLSVAFATAAGSSLTTEEVLSRVTSAKVKRCRQAIAAKGHDVGYSGLEVCRRPNPLRPRARPITFMVWRWGESADLS